jgi:uncharacterized membrane protein
MQARPRLFIAAGLLIAAAVALPIPDPGRRLLVAWDLAVAAFLAMAVQLMRGATLAQIRARSEDEDEGRVGILVLTVGAAVASLVAIIAELAHARSGAQQQEAVRLAIPFVTIVLSWTFIHIIFAFHYAHEFYGERRAAHGPPLEFPGGGDPDYWDFVYFSFVIGMTSQVSDVEVASRAIRRTVTAHGITSFFYNIALLSLTINVAAGFVTNG